MELMHSQVEASSENTSRSAFFQFLTAAYENKEHCPSTGSPGVFAIPTGSDQRAMVDSLERKRAGTVLMAKKKASRIPPKLTEAEQDLLAHMEQGYQLETDSLGGNPILRRPKDDEVIRPLSANRNTIKALEERGLIHSGKGHGPLAMTWHANKKR
jgi:hypothetical protein